MADQPRRLKPAALNADESSFAALQAISNYRPANPVYAVAVIRTVQAALRGARMVEAKAEAAFAAARDNAAAARDNAAALEWEFHNLVLGAKDQVTAQFGKDSNEVASLDPKKATEPKLPRRSVKTGIRRR